MKAWNVEAWATHAPSVFPKREISRAWTAEFVGAIFLNLEHETGMANVIVHELPGSRLPPLLAVLQCEGEVAFLIAKRLVDHTGLLGSLHTSSRDL